MVALAHAGRELVRLIMGQVLDCGLPEALHRPPQLVIVLDLLLLQAVGHLHLGVPATGHQGGP